MEIKPIVKTNVHYRDYLLKRSVLVEKIANYDDKIGEMYLN